MALLLPGCGDSRVRIPNLNKPAAPTSFRALTYRGAGVSLQAPANWFVVKQPAPGVAAISSGDAVVAVWRFPRSTPPPAGSAAMAATAAKLVAAARARDAKLQLIRSGVVAVGATNGVEVDAFENIAGQLRRVRSTHVFLPGAELVLDEYAPPAMFHAVDHSVFSPVKRSLRLLPAGQ